MKAFRTMRRATVSAYLLCLTALTGCGVFRHVTVEPLAVSSQRPSNVGAYVAVSDGDAALTELEPSNFRVYEDGQLVSADQTELTLLDVNLVAAHQVVLLVDMSGAKTAEIRARNAKAALNFVQRVAAREAVAVYAFDGGPTLVPIASLSRGSSGFTMAALESYTPRDPSRNLNGAVLAGLARLDSLLAASGRVVRVGTLVVFSEGPDVAGRSDGDKVHDAIWESQYDVIGVGSGVGADALSGIARRGLVRAQAAETLPIAFVDVAAKALEQLEKHYLVSYCSPARAGTKQLRLEVSYLNKDGEEHHGSFETEFNAKGFGPGCNPTVTPRFTLVTKPRSDANDAGKQRPGDDKSGQPGAGAGQSEQDAPVAPPDQSGYAK